MDPRPVLKHPSGYLPIAMSITALLVVVAVVFTQGTVPQQDEGAAAHLWQLLMAAQFPITVYFAAKWVPRAPQQALVVLGLQVAAAVAAMAPVFLLRW